MDLSKAINYKKLTPEQVDILQNRGTESPFTGDLLNKKDTGEYTCAACGAKLFESGTKFDSGSGWPSFDQAIPGSIKEISDSSHGMERIEVICNNCGGHLGHLFNDGPKETTGQRFCINSASLDFSPIDKK
ncbi:MAG TPA: peptide-methionine (R)-S-oxide reductase MsrB [Candidatus Saccharimonadales bacterium]|jgi:peptide-methionine (R)-S-oxide reductase|nr:peptide-methionine (R)-S-oxide reductase MsrB [Candidatus Saccharimonadales bacterium]